MGADITYIPVSKGFHLAAVEDWAGRHILSRRLSNTMDSASCIEALDAALQHPRGLQHGPRRAPTARSRTFTSTAFTERVHAAGATSTTSSSSAMALAAACGAR